ncbi:probable LRR receptor-like serine/threonine-protein kinase At1g56130 [Humulus lupulus]|uniref:probable LRR receptor-like serine/threonine-protein kinase At1g56130 n=1 Tax=Humulus lupulus TaxID=3486 RepID=UPI002B410FBA|nr:probable LRR receptor-like serine/threonine-protein kinase At1g56130 [Humulus lupulus]
MDYSFAINCGSPETTIYDDILYERDDETLGPATYYVSSGNRWAVSNVGIFTENNIQRYTSELALFQTARVSTSSLRYYGLGLEKGNYTVKLLFGEETAVLNSISWKNLGRHVFDIYIQGELVLKDFDMRKEARGVDSRFIRKNYTVLVSENYLEIHLFWAGKGTCCIPKQDSSGPSISAISVTPDFEPVVTMKNKRTDLSVGASVGIGVSIFLCVLGTLYYLQRKKKSHSNNDEELLGIDVKPFTFSYAELKMATNDFSSANKLGEGGFGFVYKGTLEDGRVVAIKQLSVTSHHGKSKFIAEIATISVVQHRHLVKLYGCCLQGDKRLLVYEYLENKSLDRALFDHSLKLDWATRFNICLGVARGLSYLHEESHIRIVHRDIKASNILLDSNLNPKISDFGLAKFYDDKKTHISTCVAGTFGYLAPEYAMSGHLTEKADVFAFGVVALEIVCVRPRSDLTLEQEKVYLLEWAWNLHERKREVELVDLTLSSEFKEEEVVRVVEIALLCTQTSPYARPPMSRVVAMLLGDVEVNQKMSRPGYFSDWRFSDVSSIVSDITATNHYYSSSSLNTMEVKSSPTNTTRPILSQSQVL